jgi:hypothetical protein
MNGAFDRGHLKHVSSGFAPREGRDALVLYTSYNILLSMLDGSGIFSEFAGGVMSVLCRFCSVMLT